MILIKPLIKAHSVFRMEQIALFITQIILLLAYLVLLIGLDNSESAF